MGIDHRGGRFPVCPEMSRFVPVCPLLSRFVLVPGPKKDKRGQMGTKRDISGQMGTRPHVGSTPIYLSINNFSAPKGDPQEKRVHPNAIRRGQATQMSRTHPT